MLDWILRTRNQIHVEARKLASALDYLAWFIFDSSKFRKIEPEKIKKILIVLINQEKGNIGGDFVTLGVLNCFKKQHPEIRLSVLSDKGTIKQFGKIRNIELIEYIEKGKLGKIKKMNYDAAIFLNVGNLDVEDFNFIPYRIGETHFGISGFFKRRKFGYTRKVYSKISSHMVGGRFKMFEALGFKFREKKPFLEFTKQEERKASSFLKKNKINRFIMIHPGGKYVAESYKEGKWPPHLWNLERYAEVADYFAEKEYSIIITGSKEESILAEEIIKNSNNKKQIINACGKLSIKESGALLKKTKLLIATDTAIVHLAYQVGVPIVELMGPSIPEVVGAWPLNSPNHKILIDKGRCYKSMRKLPFRDNFNCLKNIKIKDVIKAGVELIRS